MSRRGVPSRPAVVIVSAAVSAVAVVAVAQIRKWAERVARARPIASDLLEFSCMCERRAQYACHQSVGTGMCILGQFSEFRIQNMHSTLYVYFQSIFRNILLIF